jgi:hypothetical protein
MQMFSRGFRTSEIRIARDLTSAEGIYTVLCAPLTWPNRGLSVQFVV